MAIGTLASIKMSGFLINDGYEMIGNIIKQISGIQIYITTGIITFVLFNFFTMCMKSIKEN